MVIVKVDSHATKRGVAGVLLVGAGAALMWLYLQQTQPDDVPTVVSDQSGTAALPRDTPPAAVLADGTFTLDESMVQRIQLTYEAVSTQPSGASLRVPGTVTPNAYREVLVTPLVGGRLEQVHVQLGDRVRKGQALASIFSPDLADAQTRFLSMRAALEVERARLDRTARLVEIGAASRQELEEAQARQTEVSTQVEGARARLTLLGLDGARLDALRRAEQVSALVSVPAPSGGLIIERSANPGLVVDQSTVMFKVSDLSRVWVIANLYERNTGAIRVGDAAVVTAPTFTEQLTGRVDYIDPVLDPTTRTSKVRVEVENPGGRLQLQMYVDVTFNPETTIPILVVPASAVQRLGDSSVVYVKHAERADTFSERRVDLGDRHGNHVEVRSGLAAGDMVVTTGSFHLRAERDRTAPTDAAPPGATRLDDAKAVGELFGRYEPIRALLAADRIEGVAAAAADLQRILANRDTAASEAARILSSAQTLADARSSFGALSERLVPAFTAARLVDVHAFFCPMTKQPWVQRGPAKANPYFGPSMIACGTVLASD